jgi:tetratricopeptide (TPR) repeat protein
VVENDVSTSNEIAVEIPIVDSVIDAAPAAQETPVPEPSTSEPTESTSRIDEKIAAAQTLKDEGAILFKSDDFNGARFKYVSAMESLQYMGEGDNITNVHKSALFELTVPLSNNAALCYFKMENYTECLNYSKNTLMFIAVLEDKSTSNVAELWTAINDRGILTTKKLLDHKKKALSLAGKAYFYKQNYTEALEHLNKALDTIPMKERDDKEGVYIQKWIEKIHASESLATKKEKAMWEKAFKKDSSTLDDINPNKSPAKDTASNEAGKRKKKSLKEPSTKAVPVKSNDVPVWAIVSGLSVAAVVGVSLFYLLKRKR